MRTKTGLLIMALSWVPAGLWLETRDVANTFYEQAIGSHLERAARSSTIDNAERELFLALEGMEDWGMCNVEGKCHTSPALITTFAEPDEDVGAWRQQVERAYNNLRSMRPEERSDRLVASLELLQLEGVLMSGSRVKTPPDISVHPFNGWIWWWGLISSFSAIFGFFWFMTKVETRGFRD